MKYVQPNRSIDLQAFLDRDKPPVRLRFPSDDDDKEDSFVQLEETLLSSSSVSSKLHSIDGKDRGVSASAELNREDISNEKEALGVSKEERFTRLLLLTRLSRAAVAGEVVVQMTAGRHMLLLLLFGGLV